MLALIVGLCVGFALGYAAEAAADTLDTRRPAPAAGVLRVDLDFGSVRVVSHDAPDVRVEARSRGLGSSAYVFALSETEGVLTLTGRAQEWVAFLAHTPAVEVRAWIPASFAVEIETTDGAIEVAAVSDAIVHTDAGEIHVEDVAGRVDARTTDRHRRQRPGRIETGRIEIERVGGDVRAVTVGARIRLEAVGGNVEARAAGGAIEIDGVRGQVVAETRGAAIAARFTDAPTGALETDGGTIDVSFPAQVGADVSAHARGGCLIVDRELRTGCDAGSGPVAVPVNGGGLPLDLRAGGDIRLRTL